MNVTDPPVAAALDGPEVALTALIRERQLELVRLALFFVGDKATAEDVVQDVFARVCVRWERIAHREDPLPYIRAAVINVSRSVLRKRAVIRRFGSEPAPPMWSAEAEVVLGEERRAVLRALAELPVRRRQVLVLRYYFDLSEADIARTLRISRGTVKSTAARALAALARTLGDNA